MWQVDTKGIDDTAGLLAELEKLGGFEPEPPSAPMLLSSTHELLELGALGHMAVVKRGSGGPEATSVLPQHSSMVGRAAHSPVRFLAWPHRPERRTELPLPISSSQVPTSREPRQLISLATFMWGMVPSPQVTTVFPRNFTALAGPGGDAKAL